MTKDAEKFLCICYHDYLDKIEAGSSKTEANFFQKTTEPKTVVFPHGMKMTFLLLGEN